MRNRIGLIVAILAVSACASANPASGFSRPALVKAEMPDVQPITDNAKLARYAVWYAEVERCSGKLGDFSNVTFYTSKAHLHNNRTFDGYWEQATHSIVLRNDWEELAVKHEMMHDILNSTQHPREFFKGKCGDLTRGEAI